MALVGVALLLLSGIFREYSRILAHSREHDQLTEATGQILGQLRADAQSAFLIEQPDSVGASTATLTLSRFRPTADRFADLTNWSPHQDAQVERLRYLRDEEKLIRESSQHGTERLLSGVSAFECSLPQDELLIVQMTVTGSRRSSPLLAKIYLPVKRQPLP